MRRLFILIMAVALLTAACKIESNVVATVNADGSGTVNFEIGVDEEAREFLTQAGDPFEDAPDGATTSTVERGDMTYYVASLPFASADELTRLMTEESNAPLESFSATFAENKVRIEGSIGDSGGGFFDEGEFEGMDPGLIEDSISASIQITMPGKVIDTNADSTDGGTVTWNIPLFGSGLDIYAESDPTQSAGGGGFPAWLIIVIVVVAAAAAGYFLMNRRQKPETVVAEATDAAPVIEDETPPPPPAAE